MCYSGILYQNCVLQWCWQFVRIFLQIVRIFCHDLTDRSCPRLTPLVSSSLPDTGVDTACFVDGMTLIQMRQDAGASTVGELVWNIYDSIMQLFKVGCMKRVDDEMKNCKCAKNSLACIQACSYYESDNCLNTTKMDNDDIGSDSDDEWYHDWLLSSAKLQFNIPLSITHITYSSKCMFELTVLYKCLEIAICEKKSD